MTKYLLTSGASLDLLALSCLDHPVNVLVAQLAQYEQCVCHDSLPLSLAIMGSANGQDPLGELFAQEPEGLSGTERNAVAFPGSLDLGYYWWAARDADSGRVLVVILFARPGASYGVQFLVGQFAFFGGSLFFFFFDLFGLFGFRHLGFLPSAVIGLWCGV